MRQQQKKMKEKDKVAVALMLCFCVIALASIFTIKSNLDKIGGSGGNATQVSDQNKVGDGAGQGGSGSGSVDNVADGKAAAGASGASEEETRNSSEANAQVPADLPIVDSRSGQDDEDGGGQAENSGKMSNPFLNKDGKMTNPYAMSHLIYSVTLDQYMTHCGVDLEGAAGAQIVAVAPGTVTAVYMDDRYGASIEITHDDGFVSIYSNLDNLNLVEIGETVDSSRIIGQIGRSGAFEALEPAHLHLELLKDGVYVDPSEFVNFG